MAKRLLCLTALQAIHLKARYALHLKLQEDVRLVVTVLQELHAMPRLAAHQAYLSGALSAQINKTVISDFEKLLRQLFFF